MDSTEVFILATSKTFNGHRLDCYVEGTVKGTGDFWATREQIGQLLGYSNPKHAIGDIHRRNKERLDKFSGVSQIATPQGGTQPTTIYNFKGLLEICRFSTQPNAHKVIDVLWDIADEIRKKGYYAVPDVQKQIDELKGKNEILEARCEALQKYIHENTSFIMLGQAITPVKGTLTVGEAAKIFAQHNIKIGQNRLYKLLRDMGLIAKRKGRQRNQPTQKSIEQGLCIIVVPIGSKGVPYLTMKGLQKVANILTQEQFPLLALMTGADVVNA